MEAINSFEYNEEKDLNDKKINLNEIIPIKDKTNFNDTIEIQTTISLNDTDVKELKRYIEKNSEYTLISNPTDIVIVQEYCYKSSQHDETTHLWTIDLSVKKKGQRLAKELHKCDNPVWQDTVNFLKTKMPKILYFPTALFELPDKICLSKSSKNEKDYFFRLIIQDILDSMDDGLNIDEHIIKRVIDGNKDLIRQLELKMGRKINEVILDEWTKVLNNVKYEVGVDLDTENDEVYLEFYVNSTDGTFKLSERSLGFRWFFVFLLLTQFRGFRKNENRHVIFMFDEPAANLSNKAQRQLIKSLERISDKCTIIYTTHSHHLINPFWLEDAHVVTNGALESGDMETYSSNNTNIELHKYRNYANDNPQNVSYFQPILDVLEYIPNELDMNMPSIIVEGKNDFYTLKYFFDVQMGLSDTYIVPGMSCSNVDTLISLFHSWGKNFILLLDSDTEAQSNKKRYKEMFGKIVEEKIYTLSDIDSRWKKSIESILTSKQRTALQQKIYKSKYSKKMFNKAIQELLMTKNKVDIENSTINEFSKIYEFIKQRLI